MNTLKSIIIAGLICVGAIFSPASGQNCSGQPAANTVCAGPASGGGGLPSFRALVNADIQPVTGDVTAKCTGTVDDTAAVQAALNSGVAHVKVTTLCLAGALTIPSTVKLLDGGGTVRANGSIAVNGTLLLATSSSSLRIRDLTVDVSSSTYPTVNSIAFVTGTNSKVQNVTFTNAGRFGVYIGGCAGCAIEGSIIENFAQSSIFLSAVEGPITNLRIAHNVITGNASQTGATVQMDAVTTDTEFVDNFVSVSSVAGPFGVLAQAWVRGIIARNVIRNTKAEAIAAYGTQTAVVDNDMSWDNGISIDYGMSSVAAGDSMIIARNRIFRSGKTAIAVGSTATRYIIEDNQIIDANNATDATNGNGIEFTNSTNSHVVRRNYMVNQSTSRMIYCIREFNTADSNFYEENYCFAPTTGDYLTAGANSRVISKYDLTALNPNGNITFRNVTGINGTWTGPQLYTIPQTIASATAANWRNLYMAPATTTITGNTGSPITQLNAFSLDQQTLTDSSAVTVTDAATFYIAGPPIAAGSVTITNPWALRIAAGNVKFGAAATVVTSVTTPKVIGDTAVAGSLSLQSTSGVGTTDFIDFLVGNNGGTRVARMFHSGGVNIGTGTTDWGAKNLNVEGIVGIGSIGPISGRTLTLSDTRPTFAFYSSIGAAGAKNTGILADGGVSCGSTCLVIQNIDDAGAFVANNSIIWRHGGLSLGGTAVLSLADPGTGVLRQFLATDSSSTSTGSIITDGGIAAAKSVFVGSTLNVAGATITFTNLATDATHTDRTVCQDTTSKSLFFGSGAAGICLGTSSAAFKHDIAKLAAGLDQIVRLEAVSYKLNADHGDPDKTLYGFTAEQGEAVLPDLVGRDKAGRPQTFDYMGVVPVVVRAIQELKADNDNIRQELENIKRKVAK